MEGTENLKNEIVEATTKSVEVSVETSIKAAKDELGASIKSNTENMSEVKEGLESQVKSLQKQIDDAKQDFKSIAVKTTTISKSEFALKAEELADNASNIKGGKKMNLAFKALSFGSGDAADVPMEARIDEIKFDPHFKNRIRNNVMTMGTNGDIVRYNRQTAGVNTAAPKAQGSRFAEFAPTLSNLEEKVQTIGNIITLNEEQLDDVLGLQSFIQNQLMQYVMDTEDSQILNGSGAGNNYSGFFTDGSAWVDQREVGGGAIAESNLFDVLTNAVAQLAGENYMPTKIFLHPADFYGPSFALAKSNTAEYVLRQVQNGLVPTLHGAEIVVTPAVAKDTFAVMDSKAVAYHMRDGLEVEFYRNGDDFAQNQISVRAKLRGAVTTYLPNGVVQGTITAAIAELDAAQA